jgi:hypothetical protein
MDIANACYFTERKKNNVTFFLFLAMNLNVASAVNNLKIEEGEELVNHVRKGRALTLASIRS